MIPLTFDCYIKPEAAKKSQPAGVVRFFLTPENHLKLEEAVENLQHSDESETMIPVDVSDLSPELPPEVESLEDCKLRVYLHKEDKRGHFHLVANRKADHSLFYTNAAMVDYLAA